MTISINVFFPLKNMLTAIHYNIFDQQKKDLDFSDLLEIQMWVENIFSPACLFFFFFLI